MTAIEEKEIYKTALEKWGVTNQINMVTEECSELLVAINKFRRDPNARTEDAMNSEIADVEIMLNQLKCIFRSEARVEEIKQEKLTRLKEKLIS